VSAGRLAWTGDTEKLSDNPIVGAFGLAPLAELERRDPPSAHTKIAA
jgi:hypothetical protein